MARNINKVSRKQRRAVYEINVVRLCLEKLVDKKESTRNVIEEKNNEIAILFERGKLCTDKDIQRDMANEISIAQEAVDDKKGDLKVYQDFIRLFMRLINKLESLYDHGRFKYITKIIPEKPLPSMVLDPSRVGELTDLLKTLINECNTAMQKYKIAFKDLEDDVKEIEETRKEFNKKYDTVDKKTEAILAMWNVNDNEEVATAETPKYNLNRK